MGGGRLLHKQVPAQDRQATSFCLKELQAGPPATPLIVILSLNIIQSRVEVPYSIFVSSKFFNFKKCKSLYFLSNMIESLHPLVNQQ